MTTIQRPACFEPLQWQQWVAAARHTGGVSAGGYCTDCTPEYKARMQAAGRCEHPEIIFAVDEHGFIQGTFQQEQQP